MKLELAGKTYTVTYLRKWSDITQLFNTLRKTVRPLWGLDIETLRLPEFADHPKAGLNPYLSAIRLIQLYDGKKDVFVIDVDNLSYQQKQIIGTWFYDQKFIAHNAIFEIQHLKVSMDLVDLDVACSMILAVLVDRAERSPFEGDEHADFRGYGLAALCAKYLNIPVDKEQQTSDWGKDDLTDEQITYAAADAVLTYQLGIKMIAKIKKYKMVQVYKLFKKMQNVVCEMQLQGMPVNEEKHDRLIEIWKEQERKAKLKCESYFTKTVEVVDPEFESEDEDEEIPMVEKIVPLNLNSPKQLHEWLSSNEKYQKILPHWPKTPTGNYSFQRDKIADFLHLKPIAALMEYKKASKLLSTYGEKLKRHKNPYTNRYHSQFSLAVVRTGRLSSKEPNLQNMPRDDKDAPQEERLRCMFEVPKGRKYVVADFSQIEIRVAGAISGDKFINDCYENGIDIHTKTASELVGTKNPTDEERRLAKAVNFGFMFGMGANKFVTYAKGQFGINLELTQAYDFKDHFEEQFEGYVHWCQEQRFKCEDQGYVLTPMGRMRRLLETEVYTKAVNTPVQGGAAEVLFLSMLRLRKDLSVHNGKARIGLTVHDEIAVECDEKIAEKVKVTLEKAMYWGFNKLFPQAPDRDLVEAHIGQTWGEAK